MKNILSIDLESWIHIYKDAVKDKKNILISVNRKTLDGGYIENSTMNLLKLLEKHGQNATFFIPGELYEWYPDIIEEIGRKGHEIGYHTHNHPPRLTSPDVLEGELEKSRKFLKKFNPSGFRAPQLFITRESMACLKKWGFKYSSSTYDDFRIRKIEGIYEIPVSSVPFRKTKTNHNDELPKHLTVDLLSRQIPVGSGLLISLLGSGTSYFVNYLNKKNKPAILIVHPWQLYKHENIKGLSFILNMLFNNILWAPYSFSILKGFEKLLERHEFISFNKYFSEEEKFDFDA